MIVKDKSTLDYHKVKKELDQWIKSDYYKNI